MHMFVGSKSWMENIIEHAFVLCRSGFIGKEHLPRSMVESLPIDHHIAPLPRLGVREQAEARVLRECMEQSDGNRLAAAKALGMHRTTLWRKLRRYGLVGVSQSKG